MLTFVHLFKFRSQKYFFFFLLNKILCDRLDSAESCGTFSVSRFHFFFFFLHVNSNLTWVHCAGDKNHYSCIVYHCWRTVYALKNIKNRSYGTIHTFKNYFATVLSIFSFQFSVSATINLIQTDLILQN